MQRLRGYPNMKAVWKDRGWNEIWTSLHQRLLFFHNDTTSLGKWSPTNAGQLAQKKGNPSYSSVKTQQLNYIYLLYCTGWEIYKLNNSSAVFSYCLLIFNCWNIKETDKCKYHKHVFPLLKKRHKVFCILATHLWLIMLNSTVAKKKKRVCCV